MTSPVIVLVRHPDASALPHQDPQQIGQQVQQQVQQALQQAQRELQQAQAREAQRQTRDAQQQVREAQQQVREAQQQLREAQQQGGDNAVLAVPPLPPLPPIPPGIHTTSGSAVPPRGDIPEGAVIVSLSFFAMVAVIVIAILVARLVSRRMDRHTALPSRDPDVTARLERIEQGIDSIALEVERISEAQRFQAKLFSETGASGAANGAAPVAGALPAPNAGDQLDAAALARAAGAAVPR